MIRIGSGTHIVKIAAIIAVAVYILQMMQVSALVSVLFAFSIVCVVGSYVIKCIITKKAKAIDFLILIIMLLSILKAGIRFDFDYYKPAIIVICCIICIDLCPENRIDEKSRKQIVALFAFAIVITNILYYFGGLRYKTFGSTSLVSLNFNNPNEASMWLLFIFLILEGSVVKQKKLLGKCILVGCCISLIPMLRATASRACLIALALYYAMMIACRIMAVQKLPKWAILLITLMPALAYILYMYVVVPNLEYFESVLSFMMTKNKTLSTRVRLWNILQEDLAQSALLGQYETYYSEQMHNSLGTLWGRFGAGFVTLVCVKFFGAIEKLGETRRQLGLCAVWLVGCFEFGFFGGVAGMYMMLLVLPAIMRQDN